jgi:hypothetical protein
LFPLTSKDLPHSGPEGSPSFFGHGNNNDSDAIPAAVLIENGKIKEVGAPAKVQAPSGRKIVDLGNATLLPGLIDSHTHLLVDPVTPTEAERARHYNGSFLPGSCWRLPNRPTNGC